MGGIAGENVNGGKIQGIRNNGHIDFEQGGPPLTLGNFRGQVVGSS